MELEKVVSLLIIKHDCVIVPDFGGFVGQRNPAEINERQNKIIPPYKNVLFNKHLLTNDGLLFATVAKLNQLSYSESKEFVSTSVAKWRVALSEGNRISIENVGFLYQSQLGQLLFEQDRSTNILSSSYGLPSLSFQQEKAQEVIETSAEKEVQQPKKTIEQPKITSVIELDSTLFTSVEKEPTEAKEEVKIIPLPSTKSGWRWKIPAAVAVIALIFYSFWIPMKTNFLVSGILSVRDFNPFAKTQDIDFSVRPIKKSNEPAITLSNIEKQIKNAHANDYSYEVDANTFKIVKIEATPKVQPEKSNETVNSSASSVNYYVIANCFASEQNAKNYVETLKSKGFSAQIVDFVHGLYRVSCGNAKNLNELNQVKQNAEQNGITEYWILNK